MAKSKVKQVPKAVAKAVTKVVAPAAEVDRTIPNAIATQTFWLGASPYNPRASHNIAPWERMLTHLDKGGDKGVSGEILAKELVAHHSKPDQTHYNFISYLERRHALSKTAPAKSA